MPANDESDVTIFGTLFGWRKKHEPKSPGSASQPRLQSNTNTKRIVCFRVDQDLDRRISRALRGNASTRSDFIRSAIERALNQDAEERLRVAHSSIRWE
jgi:hypothetical protein